MRIIKVDAIQSTNNLAREFYHGNRDFEPICIVTKNQTQGKGQRGAEWHSKPGKNLTFSLLFPQHKLNVTRQFYLNIAVSLAVLNALKKYHIPNLSVKWPNDILSANYKIGGILIENILKSDEVSASIIGVGLNVNQLEFGALPKAGSLRSITGSKFNLERLLDELLKQLEERLNEISDVKYETLVLEYEENLFRKAKISVFKKPDGTIMNGIIKGVGVTGLLKIELEEGVKEYDLKEIELLY